MHMCIACAHVHRMCTCASHVHTCDPWRCSSSYAAYGSDQLSSNRACTRRSHGGDLYHHHHTVHPLYTRKQAQLGDEETGHCVSRWRRLEQTGKLGRVLHFQVEALHLHNIAVVLEPRGELQRVLGHRHEA